MPRKNKNQKRAELAVKAVRTLPDFDKEVGVTRENIVDVIVNLLHLARMHKMDPDSVITTANDHFEAEESGRDG